MKNTNDPDIEMAKKQIKTLVTGKGKIMKAITLLGLKTAEHLDSTFDQASQTQKLDILAAALGDDLFSTVWPILRPIVAEHGPAILRSAWNWAR